MQSQTRKNCLNWYESIDHTVANEPLRRWFFTNLIIYRWLPCGRPLCVGPLNFWEFGKFSRNFIWSCLYKSPCCMVTCKAAFVLFSPTLYSGKLARIWSCTAGFDVITYALVKEFFHCCACLTFWRLSWFFFFFAWWGPWAGSRRVAMAHLQLCDQWICTSVDNFFVFVIALKYGADFWHTW